MLLEMSNGGPGHAPAENGPSPADPSARPRGPRRQHGRRPLIAPAGWAFLGAMLVSAALWASFIAIMVLIIHHHPVGRGS
jgi:hypothetical protein